MKGTYKGFCLLGFIRQQEGKNQQKCQKWLKMAGSWGNGLKTPVNDLLHKNFKFRPLFGYHNFQNQIDTWETTVRLQKNSRAILSKKLSVLESI